MKKLLYASMLIALMNGIAANEFAGQDPEELNDAIRKHEEENPDTLRALYNLRLSQKQQNTNACQEVGNDLMRVVSGAYPNHPISAATLKLAKKCREHSVPTLPEDFDINKQDKYGDTLLINAVYNRDVKKVETLCILGANVNIHNKYKQPPLSIATYSYDTEIIKLLLENGADANVQSYYFKSILISAISKDITPAELFRLTNDQFYQNTFPYNILMHKHDHKEIMRKVISRRTETIELLIKYGADVNQQSDYGNTALIEAAFKNDFETVKLLLAHGADKTIKNKLGETALDYATNDEMRDLLTNYQKY